MNTLDFRVSTDNLFFASLFEVKTANIFNNIGKDLRRELYKSVYFFLPENSDIRTVIEIIALELA